MRVTILAVLLAVTLVAGALPAGAAEEGLELLDRAESLRVDGDESLLYRVLPQGGQLAVRAMGPGELTLRFRRVFGKGPRPRGKLAARVERDGKTLPAPPPVRGGPKARVVGRTERLSAEVLQTVPIPEGAHIVSVAAPPAGTLAVSFAFAAVVAGGAELPLAPLAPLAPPSEPPGSVAEAAGAQSPPPPATEPAPPAPPEPAAAPAALASAVEPAAPTGVAIGDAPEEPSAPAFTVAPWVGLAVQEQFGATGPAVGLSADWAAVFGRRLAFGVHAGWSRVGVTATGVPIPGGAARGATAQVTSSMWALPVLATVTFRPLPGARVVPYVGLGAGAVFSGISSSAAADGLALPDVEGYGVGAGGAAFAGVGLAAGPGRVAAEGRFNLARGEVEGASKGVSTGGAQALAGYQLLF